MPLLGNMMRWLIHFVSSTTHSIDWLRSGAPPMGLMQPCSTLGIKEIMVEQQQDGAKAMTTMPADFRPQHESTRWTLPSTLCTMAGHCRTTAPQPHARYRHDQNCCTNRTGRRGRMGKGRSGHAHSRTCAQITALVAADTAIKWVRLVGHLEKGHLGDDCHHEVLAVDVNVHPWLGVWNRAVHG
eukprot:366097-Chlamydomonas_euryale.AAC.49